MKYVCGGAFTFVEWAMSSHPERIPMSEMAVYKCAPGTFMFTIPASQNINCAKCGLETRLVGACTVLTWNRSRKENERAHPGVMCSECAYDIQYDLQAVYDATPKPMHASLFNVSETFYLNDLQPVRDAMAQQ